MILITGGMGFIGLHTARRFLDAGENVVITRFRASREPDFIRDELGKRVLVEPLDVTSPLAVMDVVRRHKVDGIVHLAVTAVGADALSPAEDYRVNTQVLVNVLEAARQNGVRRVTIASSVAVYGNVEGPGPYREDTLLPIRSTTATEAFKKAEEILGLHFADRANMDVVMARLSTIWGPLYHTGLNMPSRMCHAAARGAAADFVGTRGGVPFEEDGTDLCYVKDCALGLFLLQTAGSLPNRIYNVAAGKATSNAELAAIVEEITPGISMKLEPGRGPRWKENPALDVSLAARDVGYAPEWEPKRAIADYIDWLRKNPL